MYQQVLSLKAEAKYVLVGSEPEAEVKYVLVGTDWRFLDVF